MRAPSHQLARNANAAPLDTPLPLYQAREISQSSVHWSGYPTLLPYSHDRAVERFDLPKPSMLPILQHGGLVGGVLGQGSVDGLIDGLRIEPDSDSTRDGDALENYGAGDPAAIIVV